MHDGQDEMKNKQTTYYVTFLYLRCEKQPKTKLPKWDDNNISFSQVTNFKKYKTWIPKVRFYRVGHKSLNAENTALYVFVCQKTKVLFMVS